MPSSARPATDSATADAIIEAWRAESARLVGALARMTRDLELAEDLAQDALVAALEQWPESGIPDKPAAWLMTTAKRRGIDEFRRAETRRRKTAELGHGWEERSMPDLESQVDYIEDDVLRLIFLSCHPALTPESRAALTLRLVGGLTTAEIARAFLASESAMGQRISRAKKTLAESGADFELPTGKERTARLDDVMAVIYLIFNEGYTATAGADWLRPELTTEALRLASMLAQLMPDEPEAQGLLSLVTFQASRNQARLDQAGRPILLEDQDRSRWDELLIRRGLDSLGRAETLAAQGRPVGRYYLQAAIASRHAQARTAAETDWRSIAKLYDVLAEAAPGPVVEVNRAVAYGRAFGPEAGLAVLAELPAGALAGSHLLPSVRGDLLARAGRHLEAAVEFRSAAALTRNAGEQAVLLQSAIASDQAGGR
ncbi:putative RNA polymerase ECF subfamily sigma factor [Microlunatus phosphovorus NM-1]|uniref:Putative RNA polymerase ECF subfamily sigma factor n=1 Tax=Microlunatus phosphovorus (strain ATCC 700054 / DSM 10555 / JCM 9379 / NBRC 101784 / NCIMB 13414 / VKM Ac-1990 / NM-1) TaxID=1032480 RepID=F5XT76_MICPN|nr:RNA polymerase sigma factor [Microlunatus phosphovorus]BAK34948.1 putative RNA polymerase ECF subfamily sigma factor [Microlunatus phosphovorus NM-1]